MAFIQQTSLNQNITPTPPTNPEINTIITMISIQTDASLVIDNNGGGIAIVTGSQQGMVIDSGSRVEILGV